MLDYVMSVRAVRRSAFVAEVGESRFLLVPPGETPAPSHGIAASAWYKAVLRAAAWQNAGGEARGDLLFILHGYNMSPGEVIDRHRRIRASLEGLGFRGVCVSFDWPSDDKALAYLPDRHRAKRAALSLVRDGIAWLSGRQAPDCTINVHALCHSTGAYVLREAFDDADDTALPNGAWSVSQVAFIAADVSAGSMAAGQAGDAIHRHCARITNYFNRHDEALDLSNVKRLGAAPRAGRVGLPADAASGAVNVDCTQYYESLVAPASALAARDQPDGFVGLASHSWYFGNLAFARDLFDVIIGKDRQVCAARSVSAEGRISLGGTP